jgi:hypothetical protein
MHTPKVSEQPTGSVGLDENLKREDGTPTGHRKAPVREDIGAGVGGFDIEDLELDDEQDPSTVGTGSVTTISSTDAVKCSIPVALLDDQLGEQMTYLASRTADPATYLGYYGYEAESSHKWAKVSCHRPCPELRIVLGGHSEQSTEYSAAKYLVRHTYYSIQFHFSCEKPPLRLEWNVQRRLAQLREELHDIVKEELGKEYATVFAQAPFAKRGGPAGTTGRLQTWLQALAACVNEQSMPPGLVAKVLQYFGAPLPPYLSKGPATPQKTQPKVIPQIVTDPLPKVVEPPKPDIPPPSVVPPPSNGYSDAACSPIAFREDLEPSGPQATVADEDEHGEEPVPFSSTQRQHGVKKLRNWFIQLKRSIGKKLLD